MKRKKKSLQLKSFILDHGILFRARQNPSEDPSALEGNGSAVLATARCPVWILHPLRLVSQSKIGDLALSASSSRGKKITGLSVGRWPWDSVHFRFISSPEQTFVGFNALNESKGNKKRGDNRR